MSDSITCPQCGRTSYHPEDVRQRYCGSCHQFHSDMERGSKLRTYKPGIHQCPHCGKLNDCAAHARGPGGSPAPGDITICAGCGIASEFHLHGFLLAVRPIDREKLSLAERIDIEALEAKWRRAVLDRTSFPT
jgi:hypothetical protein